MAKVDYLIQARTEEYRQCLINDEIKAVFHRWIVDDKALLHVNTYMGSKAMEVIEKKFSNDGISLPNTDIKIISKTYALVELENGQVEKVDPEHIKFVDIHQMFTEYAWPPEEETNG